MSFKKGFEKVAISLNPVPALKTFAQRAFRPSSDAVMRNAMMLRGAAKTRQAEMAAKALGGTGSTQADVVKNITQQRAQKEVSPRLRQIVSRKTQANKMMTTPQLQSLKQQELASATAYHKPQVAGAVKQQMKSVRRAAIEDVAKPESVRNIKAQKANQATKAPRDAFYRRHPYLTAAGAYLGAKTLLGGQDQQPPPPPQVVQY